MQSFTPEIETISLRHYFLLIWKWMWLLALVSAVAAGSAYLAGRMTAPVYSAKTTLLINESGSTAVNDYTAILMSERQASTYAEMLTNRVLLESVIADLKLHTTVTRLAASLQVELIRNTRLISIGAEDTDPVQAAAIANSVATQFIKQLSSFANSNNQTELSTLEGQIAQMDALIQTTNAELAALKTGADTQAERDRLTAQLSQYRQTYAGLLLRYQNLNTADTSTSAGVYQIEPAIAPKVPVRPQVMMNTLLAAAIGLLIAALVVVLIEALDDTIRNPADVARYLGVPVFGIIPSHSIEEGKPVTLALPRSPVSDAYRALRANINFASVDRPLKKLLITSSAPNEGKTTLAVNLGVVVAQNEQSTVVVDTDFRRARVHEYLGLANRNGLSSILAQKTIELVSHLQAVESVPQLEVLTSGDYPPNPTELLGSEKMARILGQLAEHADMVILDSPPLMVVTDAAMVAMHADGVLLVVKPGVSRVAAVKNSIEQLRRAKANLLGVVLNDVNLRRDHYYGNYYYNSYNAYYQNASDVKRPKRSLTGWLRKSKKK